jgi:hypothetical protein
MSEKNKKRGVPKPFFPHLVKWKFPVDRPIFWAGQQDTKFPDTYVEPGPYKHNLMQIPTAIRFIVGGAPAQVNVNRWIYLGYRRVRIFGQWFTRPVCPSGGILESRTWWDELTTVNEIASLYDANMTSAQAIEQVNYSAEFVSANYSFGAFNLFDLISFGYYANGIEYTCPDMMDYTAPFYVAETHPTIGPTGPDHANSGINSLTNYINYFNYLVANPNTYYFSAAPISAHYYLNNVISGSFQTNTLRCIFVEGSTAQRDPEFPMPTGDTKNVSLTGLDLEP